MCVRSTSKRSLRQIYVRTDWCFVGRSVGPVMARSRRFGDDVAGTARRRQDGTSARCTIDTSSTKSSSRRLAGFPKDKSVEAIVKQLCG